MKIKILNIKNFIKILLSITLLIVFTAFPSVCIKGAQNGLKTALYCVVPSILPFMILSKYILYSTGENNSFVRGLSKVLKLTPSCVYSVIFGSLSGYPTGAILISDLLKKKE